MPSAISLTDSEGFIWDLGSGLGGLGVENGTNDAFDGGLLLRVNGTIVTGTFSVDENGREANTVPVLIGGIAVQRSILVSDTTISSNGFARFLESFTNTTDQTVTITVETITGSGADSSFQFTADTNGDGFVTAADTGFVSDDANTTGGDPSVLLAYSDGTLLPTAFTTTGASSDVITVTHTLTLAPGETQSVLQFAAQNTNTSDGLVELAAFTADASGLQAANLLAGLSREEQLSIVNYSGFDALQPAHTLVDSDGNRWGIDDHGRLSSLDSNALVKFEMPILAQSYATVVSTSVDAANNEVTVVTAESGITQDGTVTYTYRALPDQGLIRLLVTWQSFAGAIGNVNLDPTVTLGANPALVSSQALSPAFGVTSGVVLDDSESGNGGTRPALTFVFGATGNDNTSSVGGNFFVANAPGQGIHAGQTKQYLFFFALNDTGLAALADLTRLNTPGPQELIGLSAAEVAGFLNFDLDETDRLQETIGQNGVDDVITGHAWGDSIRGGTGDDDIAALGSDDVVNGGDGEDDIDGGDGADSLFGGNQGDLITGGTGGDSILGDDGEDQLNGQAGDDTVSGGSGTDRVVGGAGTDSLLGDGDRDTLFGNSGNDSLFGGGGFDELFGGRDNDVLFGGDAEDVVTGGRGNDSLTGDAGADVIDGGTGGDTLLGGEDGDRLFGGAEADSLYGGNGNDTLYAGDSTDTGDNRLFGGQDSDTYFVESTTHTVVEVANGTGADTVFSKITYTLTDHVERLQLDGVNLNGRGNTLANELVGTAGRNILNGAAGADTMRGGDENDTYIVDNAGDVVVEAATAGAGRDKVEASVTHTLAENVENLTLTGTAAINGTGNASANIIIGNTAANVLTGLAGNDTLTGGTGADRFVFNTALNASTNIDTITDFDATDFLRLDSTIFTSLGAGTLAATRFVLGTAALDGNDFILYDQITGILRYDADGNGTTFAAIAFADLGNNFALTNADISVF
ncbi:MAG: calcium-binding protein [Paracoccaceae bacterium]